MQSWKKAMEAWTKCDLEKCGNTQLDHTVPSVKLTWQVRLGTKLRIKNQLLRQTVGEFLATFCLVVFGQSLAASVVFSGNQKDLLLIGFGQGLAVIFALYLGGGISGAVLNPAICVAFAIVGKIHWINCLCYSAAEYFAAFGASLVVYAIHYESLNAYDDGMRQVYGENGTAGIFAAFPSPQRSIGGAFFHAIMAAGFLLIGIMAMTDSKNWSPQNGFFPVALGLVIMLMIMAFGYGESLSMNPAGDLAARVFTVIAGYGTEAFSVWDYKFFWIPIVGSHLGAILGALLYMVLIEVHHPPEVETLLPQ